MPSSLLRLCLLSLALAAAGCGPDAPASAEAEALLAGAADALHGSGAVDGGSVPDGKVAVCHVPPGNPANAHTIVIGEPALSAHLRHGDPLGACGGADAGTDGGGDGSGGGSGDGGACRAEGDLCSEAGDCCTGLACGGEGRCVILIN
jgi:hypothetical protein